MHLRRAPMKADGVNTMLVLRVAGKTCALPVAHVVETMRPLPVKTVAGTPEFVRGLAIVRGAPVPVVDLAALLGGAPSVIERRFVTVRAGERRIALAAEEVLGVRILPAFLLSDLPPLLRDAGAQAIDAIGALDAQLLVVLHAGSLLPEEVWEKLGNEAASP